MSTDFFAGTLCATQLNEQIFHPDLDPGLIWTIVNINYAHQRDTVRVVTRSREPGTPNYKHTVCLQFACDDLVTVAVG